jgi:hypothetical protein
VRARYSVRVRGLTAVVTVTLEDGRGFTLHTGVDRLEGVEGLVREHARALFDVEVSEVEEAGEEGA